MNALRHRVFGALLCVATLGAAPPGESPAETIPAAAVLQRYAEALAGVARPPYQTFEVAIEQVGLHDLSEVHRIYRSGRKERDETLARAGTALKVPIVRVSANRPDPYDVLAIAPKPTDYTFTYAGRRKNGARTVYAFRTSALGASSFAVTDVLIDAQRFLPAVVAFSSVSAFAHGKGRVVYAAAGAYWMPAEALVSASAPGLKRDARERLAWSRYRFPRSLPNSTFAPPVAVRPSPPL